MNHSYGEWKTDASDSLWNLRKLLTSQPGDVPLTEVDPLMLPQPVQSFRQAYRGSPDQTHVRRKLSDLFGQPVDSRATGQQQDHRAPLAAFSRVVCAHRPPLPTESLRRRPGGLITLR